MIEIVSATFAAGEVKQFHMLGSYLELLDVPYAVDVELHNREGVILSRMNNAEASFYNQGQDFATVQIRSAQAQTLRFFIGDSAAGTRRSAGVVQVVDSAFALTRAGQAFAPYYAYTPAAGTLAHIQIQNPAGSGRLLEVNSLVIGVGAAMGMGVALLSGAPLANAAGAVAYQSKVASGGGAGVGQVRFQDNAAILAGPRQIFGNVFAAQGSIRQDYKAPIVLLPGDSIVAYGGAAAVSLTFAAEVVERVI